MSEVNGTQRPTKTMQEAVNLSLDGQKDEALKKLKEHEHRQHTADQLEKFVKLRQDRGLGKYTFERKCRGTARGNGENGDGLLAVNCETRIITLIRLEAKIRELLAQQDAKEVETVRGHLKNYERKKKELEEAEALIA